MSGTPKQKDAGRGRAKRPLPPYADYSDEVTDKDYERIKRLVKKEEYEDAEEISGPGW